MLFSAHLCSVISDAPLDTGGGSHRKRPPSPGAGCVVRMRYSAPMCATLSTALLGNSHLPPGLQVPPGTPTPRGLSPPVPGPLSLEGQTALLLCTHGLEMNWA